VTRRIDVFEDFHTALEELIQTDSYLIGISEISDQAAALGIRPSFENLDITETVIPVAGAAGNPGFLKYRGRRDGELLEADDLHLMGAIAGFVSVLTAQAHAFRKKGESERILQFLLDRLPLGVVCLGASGDVLIENKAASRFLGDSGAALIRQGLSDQSLTEKGSMRLHIEAGGELLYVEGRRLDIGAGLFVSAFVLYEMGGRREKLMLELDRSIYRAGARGAPLSVALLEDRSEAGCIYREMKSNHEALQIDPSSILPLDAFSCACVFKDKRLRSARFLLRNTFSSMNVSQMRGALVSGGTDPEGESPAQELIEQAREQWLPLSELSRPSILVLDPYPPICDSLDLLAGDLCNFESVSCLGEAAARIELGACDGLFIDIDTYSQAYPEWIRTVSESAGPGFVVYYVSHKQPSMIYSQYGMGLEEIVLQKPFEAEPIRDSLSLRFNFA